MTATLGVRAAYRMFYDWRRTTIDAGYRPLGKARVAFHALDNICMGVSRDTPRALRLAREALLEWSATNEDVANACKATLELVTAEIAALDAPAASAGSAD